jgi:hypothetical protein
MHQVRLPSAFFESSSASLVSSREVRRLVHRNSYKGPVFGALNVAHITNYSAIRANAFFAASLSTSELRRSGAENSPFAILSKIDSASE